ncbi:MAG: hypothetical protein AABY65_13295 [Nitrospirota bacterium]
MGVSCVMMADLIAETAKLAYQIKAVVSDRGIVLGPVRMEHKTLRAPGVAYESDEQGSAVAGVVYKGKIEIRRHRAFGEDRVLGMLRRLESLAELSPLRGFAIVYGGKPLGVFGQSPATPDAAGRGMS